MDAADTKAKKNARLEDIADHLDSLRAAGTYAPRVDTLPYYTGPVLD